MQSPWSQKWASDPWGQELDMVVSPLCGFWESNLSLLQEQCLLLTAEPFLQPPFYLINNIQIFFLILFFAVFPSGLTFFWNHCNVPLSRDSTASLRESTNGSGLLGLYALEQMGMSSLSFPSLFIRPWFWLTAPLVSSGSGPGCDLAVILLHLVSFFFIFFHASNGSAAILLAVRWDAGTHSF